MYPAQLTSHFSKGNSVSQTRGGFTIGANDALADIQTAPVYFGQHVRGGGWWARQGLNL